MRNKCTRLLFRIVTHNISRNTGRNHRWIQTLSSQPKVFHPNSVDLNNQSVLLPGPDRARASKLIGDPQTLLENIPITPNIKTVYDILTHGLEVSSDGDCCGSRNASGVYEWLKYSDVVLRSQYVGSALIDSGLAPNNDSYVGVYASNRTEFFLTLYACAGYSMVLVPLYDSIGAQNVDFIMMQVNFPLVIVNSNGNSLNVLQSAKKLPALKKLIIMDDPLPETIKLAKEAKIELQTFQDFEAIGKKTKKDLVLPTADQLFVIPYTSGTTGTPKGVMLTHKNIIACVSSLLYGYGPGGIYGGTILSYFPAAHIYEIMNQVASLYFGRRIAFLTPNVATLLQDFQDIKPTILPLVPRLMNAIYSKATEAAKSKKWKWFLLNFALSRKEKQLKKGIISKTTIWDKLFFKKFHEALGGEVRLIITTSAPVSPDVMKFFRCASGCYIYEAYGQTEVLAGTMSLPHEYSGGHVGPPLTCNHMKLVDVPDMNYFAIKDEGEICFKGPNVFQGYFKNPEATKACIDDDGWHHSGDIGQWLANGTLKIIDRKKHLFKLSQGEYIAPEKVENAYNYSPLVLQIFVDGFTDQSFVVAIMIPDPNTFPNFLKSNKFDVNQKDILADKNLRIAVLQHLHKWGSKKELNSLEQAKNLYLTTEAFTLENGLLTPTLKLKRNEVRNMYKSIVEKMYEEGPLIKSKH